MQDETNMQYNMEESDRDVLQEQKARLEQEIDKSKRIMVMQKKEMQYAREKYKQEMELRKKEMKTTHQNWVRQRPDRLVKQLDELQARIEEQSGQWNEFREYLEQWQSQVTEQMEQLQEQTRIQQEQMEQMRREIERRMEEQREWMQRQFEQMQGQTPIATATKEKPQEEIEIQQGEIVDETEEQER
jgi:hypothetical protein